MEGRRPTPRTLAGAAVLVALAVAALVVVPGATGDPGVVVRDTRAGEPVECPDLDLYVASAPCLVRVSVRGVDVTVESLVGTLEFVEGCSLSHRLQVDAGGRTLVDDITINGSSPCNDIDACERRPGIQRLWRGQVDALDDGRVVHDLGVCIDSCMGHFEGTIRYELEHDRYGWGSPAARRPIGASGLALSGELRIDDEGFDIEVDGG